MAGIAGIAGALRPLSRPVHVRLVASSRIAEIGDVMFVAPALPATLPAAPSPAHFVRHVTNPWFPLRAGTTLVYDGAIDGRAARDVVAVTRRTRRIRGVVCTAIRDKVFLDGKLVERTIDWYT